MFNKALKGKLVQPKFFIDLKTEEVIEVSELKINLLKDAKVIDCFENINNKQSIKFNRVKLKNFNHALI